MESMNNDLQALIQSYFDCGWEEFEGDSKVKEIITEMKELADMYLKTKSSTTGNNMVATIAMEAELKKFKAELIKRVNMLKSEKENQAEEYDQVDDFVKVKSKINKMPMIAIGSALVAIVLGGVSLFWSLNNSVSRSEFEASQSDRQSFLKNVNAANQADRSDIETLQVTFQAFRQELEASKQELAAFKLEMSEKFAAQENELNMKISSLQKKAAAPAAKAKPAPTKSAKSVKSKPTTKSTRR